MPTAPKRPCPHPNCPALVTSGRCDAHGGQAPAHRWSTNRRQDVTRLRGRANQERRARLFAREPLCRACSAQGRVTAATIADHVIPLAEGGRDDDANLQPLCQLHSDQKTNQESTRGRARNK